MDANGRGASVGDRIARVPGPLSRSSRPTTVFASNSEIQKLKTDLQKAKQKRLAARAAHAAAAAEESGTKQELYEIAREAHDAARNELARREMALESQLKLKNKAKAEDEYQIYAARVKQGAWDDWRSMSREKKNKLLELWKGKYPKQRNEVAQKGKATRVYFDTSFCRFE